MYVDAKQIGNLLYISEHDEKAGFQTRNVRVLYVAYEEDEFGTYRSITGKKLRRVTFKTKRDLVQAREQGRSLWESDISPTFRYLESAYPDDGKLPPLRITVFDIEVDRDSVRGYAPTDNPFCPIISITLYHKWKKQAITIALPPPNLSFDQAAALMNDPHHEDGYGALSEDNGYFLVSDEETLLELFADLIDETDIITGWNCMPLDESVWLEDQIVSLGSSLEGQVAYANGHIKGIHHTGDKKVYQITTSIGSTIRCSSDHRIPVCLKEKAQYRSSKTIQSTVRDIRAADLVSLEDTHDMFVCVPKHHNGSIGLHYSDLPGGISDDLISLDWCRLLGLVFTDGSITDRDAIGAGPASIYSSVREVQQYYGELVARNDWGTGNWGSEHKGNRRLRVRKSKISGLLPLIYMDGKKRLDVNLLSRFSADQFRAFFTGVVDGDGYLSTGTVSVCNFEGQLPALQELLLWNGVVSTNQGSELRINQTPGNRDFVLSLPIAHPNRILSEFTTLARQSSNKKVRLYDTMDCYWSRISVKETDDIVPMADIETENHYFFSRGVKVHNSELYDIPYIVNRARVVMGNEDIEDFRTEMTFSPSELSASYLKRLSAFPVLPDVSEIEVYGRRERIYHLLGRRHVDYLVFYKKFVKAELLSFTLDAILQHEVKQTKVKFDGSIDEFYRNEFRRFLAYNRQDVMGLSAIDDKRKLIDLGNQMIHMSGVTMDKAAGSVVKIEQAVLRELHRERHEISWDKIEREPDRHVPGAFVVDPQPGKHGWGCSIDASSLYPTMIRLLNISPETMVGQLDLARTDQRLNEHVDDFLKIPHEDRELDDERHSYRLHYRKADGIDEAYKQAWRRFTGAVEYHDVIEGSSAPVKLLTLDGQGLVMTGREMRDFIRQNNWCITANGTVFTLEREGIIPYCLTKWYNERQEFRKKAGEYKKLAVEAKEAGDAAKGKEYSALAEYHDMVQEAKKVFLNSTYGAYLNRFFRFYDPRCGRSVTLSGRVVIKHMCRKSCELLTGSYDFDGTVLLAGDTDSSYISLEHYLNHKGIERTADNAVELADWLADQINESFAEHLSGQFLVPPERVHIVQVKRESVYDRAIFKDKKKRYAMHIVDSEGTRIPTGDKDELKVVGMETKRSDTPSFVQNFLQECLRRVLVNGYEEEDIRDFVQTFRDGFRQMPAWSRGSPVRLKNLYTSAALLEQYDKAQDDQDLSAKKPLIYYAVVGAMNTNRLMDQFNEPRWEKLRDGDKIEVLYLRPGNVYRIDSVAIRVGETYVPEWFKQLPFDDEAHELKLIDQKLGNVFGHLGWDFAPRDHTGYEIFA